MSDEHRIAVLNALVQTLASGMKVMRTAVTIPTASMVVEASLQAVQWAEDAGAFVPREK